MAISPLGNSNLSLYKKELAAGPGTNLGSGQGGAVAANTGEKIPPGVLQTLSRSPSTPEQVTGNVQGDSGSKTDAAKLSLGVNPGSSDVPDSVLAALKQHFEQLGVPATGNFVNDKA